MHYDPFVDAATAAMRRHLAGVRVAGVDAIWNVGSWDLSYTSLK